MIKICKNCGKEFEPERKLAECCTKECTHTWRRKYQKEYYKKVGKEKERAKRQKIKGG